MQNRRPPHPKSSGRYGDRTGGNAPYRREGGSENPTRGKRKPPGQGGWGNRTDRQSDGQSDYRRSGSHPTRNDRNRHADHRFGYKSGRPSNRSPRGKNAENEPLIRLTSDSQITDGKFRGRELQNSSSPFSAHTQRKVREALFRILARRVKACRLLDLGAASGTIGIEAISRGAMLATFVERSARMCSYIRKNLADLGIKDGHGEVVEMEVLPYLKRNARRRRMWDIVYLDLPESDDHAAIVEYLSRGSSLKPSGLLIIQHSSATSHAEKMSQLSRWRTVDLGETILSIYERI